MLMMLINCNRPNSPVVLLLHRLQYRSITMCLYRLHASFVRSLFELVSCVCGLGWHTSHGLLRSINYTRALHTSNIASDAECNAPNLIEFKHLASTMNAMIAFISTSSSMCRSDCWRWHWVARSAHSAFYSFLLNTLCQRSATCQWNSAWHTSQRLHTMSPRAMGQTDAVQIIFRN